VRIASLRLDAGVFDHPGCRVKAGTERAEFCEVTDRDCDGDAK
jgi:hypothetical protein